MKPEQYSPSDLKLISDLLRDATLVGVFWDRPLATMVLTFACLRRKADGSELEERSVSFQLRDVAAVVIGYDSTWPETRPSQFDPGGRITPADLAEWRFRPQEAALPIDSPRLGGVA